MDRRPAAYQPSSAAEQEDSIGGQNLSASRRLSGSRSYRQWYDAVTNSPFVQLQHRRLGPSMVSTNYSTQSPYFGVTSEPATSRFAIPESYPSTEEVRAGSKDKEYSEQRLRDQRDNRYSLSRPQIAHNFPEGPSSDLPTSRHQKISSVPPVLPKKRLLPFSAYNESFSAHSKHPRINRNEGRVSYNEVSHPVTSTCLSYSSENVRYVQKMPDDRINSTSHVNCESMSIGSHNKMRRSYESDFGRSHDTVSTSERQNILEIDHFNITCPSQNYGYNSKDSQIAKEKFQMAAYNSSVDKGLPSPPYSNVSCTPINLLPQSSLMYPPSDRVNSHYGNEYSYPISGQAFNLSASKSDCHNRDISENTVVNLPQKEIVQLSMLQTSGLCNRDSIEEKSAIFSKPPDNALNPADPTIVHGPVRHSKLHCDPFHSSNFSNSCQLDNVPSSTSASSYDTSPIRQRSTLESNTPLNFSTLTVSRSGRLFCSATSVNNEFSENSDSSHSFSRSPNSHALPYVESSITPQIHEKHSHSIQVLSDHSVHNVQFRLSEAGDLLPPEKNSTNSVSCVKLGDKILQRILHKHPESKDSLKVECSSSDRSKTPKSAESSRRRRRRAVGLVCGVCGDSARSLHFGGVSCDSCKAFFRRAVIAKAYPSFLCVTTGLSPQIETRIQNQVFGMGGETDKRFQYGFDIKDANTDSCISSSYGKHKPGAVAKKELRKGSLDSSSSGRLKKCPPITITTRKYCQSCRFQKCIDIGMEISWVTLETDVNRRISEHDSKSNESRDSIMKHGWNKGSAELEDDEQRRIAGEKDPDTYLTKSEQKQIENLVDIYRSVFWGVPEPVYHRPALIDFPPAFSAEDVSTGRSQKKKTEISIEENESSSSNETTICGKNFETKNMSSSCAVNNQSTSFFNSKTTNAGEAESSNTCETSCTFDHEVDSHSNPQIPCYILEESQLSSAEIQHIRNLPQDHLGVNMYRKALRRRPRPWLIRQLMGYTLRFMHVVVKILHGVGRSLSVSDRMILLRQGMTRLTFLNSVIMYDTSIEAWPERIFPPLPLVLQDGESGFISEQRAYLQGVAMHPDEVATVVASEVLEHQLLFIRGIKTCVGSDFPSMFLLMAIMLFDSTEAGLEQPKVVEQIQSNYCYLLKQYLSWKFHDGPPPNPGDGRPANFSHSPNTIGINKDSNLKPTCSSDPSNVESNPRLASFTFEKMEGYYFSPPYPPSPASPKAIYPLLLTKLADLQQTAHNYSSTPFILQGPEVDEIDNLLARIQVFMSDILTSGPSINDDEGGSGDSSGMGGNMSFQKESGDREEVSGNRNGNYLDRNGGGKPNSLGKEVQNNDNSWIASSRQDLSWDSSSSKDDDTYSGSSLSVISIGESIDEIVGALITSDDGNSELRCENDENLVRSLEFWDEKEFFKLSAEEGSEILLPSEIGSFGERGFILQEHIHKTQDFSLKNFREGNYKCIERENQPEKYTAMDSQFLLLNSSSNTSKDMSNPHVEPSEQIKPKEHFHNYCGELKMLEKGSLTPCPKMETHGLQGITKEEACVSYQNGMLEEARSYSYSTEGLLPEANTDAKDKCKTTSNRSFWDCLKATGRAILGFGSSHPDSKSDNDLLQPMTSQQEEKCLDNLLEHVERPESNSSGYVSSPSPLNIMKDYETFHSGADWEDLFQRL